MKHKKCEFLGKGGNSECYIVSDNEGIKYAGKFTPIRMLEKPKKRDFIGNEVMIHSSMVHPNVVDFVDLYETDEDIVMILELCENKSLEDMLSSNISKRFDEHSIRYYLRQILDGIEYIHEQNVIHRDLKLGNIFVNKENIIKIGDFGMATYIEYKSKTMCGTPNYLPPELFENIFHSFKSDIWSVGVMLYTMVIGKPPFETDGLKTTYRRIRDVIYYFPDKIRISDNLKNLIKSILKKNPAERLSIDEIRNHNFLTEIIYHKKYRNTSIDNIYLSIKYPLSYSCYNREPPMLDNLINKWHYFSEKKELVYSVNNGRYGIFNKVGKDKISFKELKNIDSITTVKLKNPKKIYISKWIQTKNAIIFRLSNDTLQAHFFIDNSNIMLSEGVVTLITSDKLESFWLNNINKKIQPHVNYVKDLLKALIDKR